MLRAFAIILFFFFISCLGAVLARAVVTAAGLDGIIAFLAGYLLFSVIVGVSVLLIAAINDRINDNMQDYENNRKHKF